MPTLASTPVPDSPHLATVQRYYRLVDRGDIDGLVDLFAEDAVYHRPGYPPIVGRDSLRRFYVQQRVIDVGAHSLDRVVPSEPVVAVHGSFAGKLRNGSQVSVRFADFFEINGDGHFQRRDTFFFTASV